MKKNIYLLMFLCFVQLIQAQENSEYRIIRSNLGSSGSSQSVVTAKGTYNISQSVGQASVIGTHSNNGYVLRQGYQQPATKLKLKPKAEDYSLNAKVYPNPFNQKVTITFSALLEYDISIVMYDITGKIIHTQNVEAAQGVEIQLQDIASGTYFLKVMSGKKYFNTKLLKI